MDCSEGSDNIVFARLETTESGSVEGNTGTTCTEIDSTTFDCEPTDPEQLVTGRFTTRGRTKFARTRGWRSTLPSSWVGMTRAPATPRR